jgi:hypothetical protein
MASPLLFRAEQYQKKRKIVNIKTAPHMGVHLGIFLPASGGKEL